jgi:hypothetical protein
VGLPRSGDFIFMLPNQSKGRGDYPGGQAEVGSELDVGLEPELCLPRGVLHMDVHPSLFPREEWVLHVGNPTLKTLGESRAI